MLFQLEYLSNIQVNYLKKIILQPVLVTKGSKWRLIWEELREKMCHITHMIARKFQARVHLHIIGCLQLHPYGNKKAFCIVLLQTSNMQWCGLFAKASRSLVAACVLFVCILVLRLLVAATLRLLVAATLWLLVAVTLKLLSCSNLAALSCSNLVIHCLWFVCGSLCVERV